MLMLLSQCQWGLSLLLQHLPLPQQGLQQGDCRHHDDHQLLSLPPGQYMCACMAAADARAPRTCTCMRGRRMTMYTCTWRPVAALGTSTSRCMR